MNRPTCELWEPLGESSLPSDGQTGFGGGLFMTNHWCRVERIRGPGVSAAAGQLRGRALCGRSRVACFRRHGTDRPGHVSTPA